MHRVGETLLIHQPPPLARSWGATSVSPEMGGSGVSGVDVGQARSAARPGGSEDRGVHGGARGSTSDTPPAAAAAAAAADDDDDIAGASMSLLPLY